MELILPTALTGSTVIRSTIRSIGIPGITIHSIRRTIRGDIMTITGPEVPSGLGMEVLASDGVIHLTAIGVALIIHTGDIHRMVIMTITIGIIITITTTTDIVTVTGGSLIQA